ncbi:MAG TPA: zf-HC2 domain-containing protein [Lacipirellula sp.]
MSNVNDNFNDELLSAYVDGELTADERAAVEERLRADPHVAELVEELRSISSAIKSLPRETLGHDLRASIQAELDETRVDAQRQVIPLSEPLDPPRGFYRGFLWSTIAIAAALMIMFLQYREQQDQRNVAVAAKDEAGGVQEHTARNNRRREMGEDGQLPPQGEMRSLESPRDAAEPAAGVGGGMDSLGAEASSAVERSLDAADAAAESLSDMEAVDEQVAQGQAVVPPAPEAPEEAAEPAFRGGRAAATRPAANTNEPSVEDIPLQTVELEVRSDEGVQQFARLLAENNFRLSADSAVAPDQDAAASREVRQHYYGQRRAGQHPADQANASAVHVVVEGTPAQVEQLVDSYQQQPDVFAEVAAPESLTRLGRQFRREPASSAGAQGSQLQAEPSAVVEGAAAAGKPQGQAESSFGVAWFVAPADAPKSTALYSRDVEAKEKDAAIESNVQLGAPVQPLAEDAQSDRAGAEVASPKADRFAKQLQSPPAQGRVRLKFVLRLAPQPATEAAAAPGEP